MWKYILNYVSSNRNNYKNLNTNKYHTIYYIPHFLNKANNMNIFDKYK